MTETLQPVLAILLVLGLLAGALWLLRRKGVATLSGGMPSFGSAAGNLRQLQAIDRVSLGPQHAVHLIRVGGRLVLVGTSPGSCQFLDVSADELRACYAGPDARRGATGNE
jgi:flagellar biogenesis protein FliO